MTIRKKIEGFETFRENERNLAAIQKLKEELKRTAMQENGCVRSDSVLHNASFKVLSTELSSSLVPTITVSALTGGFWMFATDQQFFAERCIWWISSPTVIQKTRIPLAHKTATQIQQSNAISPPSSQPFAETTNSFALVNPVARASPGVTRKEILTLTIGFRR